MQRYKPIRNDDMKALTGKRVLMMMENTTYSLDLRVRQESMTLVNTGYQVSVICQRGQGESWRENKDGIFIYRYPAPIQGRGGFSYVLEYTYSFAAMFILSLFVWVDRGFDIIHAANPPDTTVFLALFYKLFGKRFIFDHHDIAPELYLIRYPYKRSRFIYHVLTWLETTSCRFADHIIAANQSHKNIEIQRGHVPEDRITIVRNGPILDCFDLIQAKPILDTKKNMVFGYIGAIAPQDGLDYFLRALQLLVTVLKRHDFSCVIIGNGSILNDLKAQAKQLDILSKICFTGFLPQPDALKRLATVDVCVDSDPSNIYNDHCTMIKMMEYMALGKPVVAFDLPEHRVTAGDAALYAKPNDELDFARKLETLMDAPELRARMGKLGRQRVENELAWRYQSVNLIWAYETMLAHSK